MCEVVVFGDKVGLSVGSDPEKPGQPTSISKENRSDGGVSPNTAVRD